MSKEGYTAIMDNEPIKEDEIVCSFCGPKTNASWHVVLTDGEELFICEGDHHALEDAELILGDRRIGEITWEEICEYRKFLDDLEYQKYLGELEKIKNVAAR
jgi:hypothetical protein